MTRGKKTIDSYRHPAPDPVSHHDMASATVWRPDVQIPDPTPGNYYVSVRREGGNFRLLFGPYATHAEALANVDRGRARAEQLDPKACWYSFGTVRMADDFTSPGILEGV